MLTADDVVAALCDRPHFSFSGDRRLTFRRVVVDSRQVEAGDLFVALAEGSTDGHLYVGDALRRGATGVLARVDRFGGPVEMAPSALFLIDDTLRALQAIAAYWRRRHTVRVVGVTGSVGKTTTRDVLAAVLSARYKVLKSEKNFNNEIGLPLTLLRLDHWHEMAVLEMGMYAAGEIDLLCRLALPEIGVITNVGPSHLERLGSIERIAAAKEELVQNLPAHGLAVLNGDDALVRAMAERSPARVVFYGTTPFCDVWGSEILNRGLAGTSFRLHAGDREMNVLLPLLGRPGVYAALAAVAVGLAQGTSWSDLAQGLSQVTAGTRLAVYRAIHGATVIDDTYNASPASMAAALEVLKAAGGRRIAILGDMLELGSLEVEGHQAAGRAAAAAADLLVVVGPRARIIGEEAARNGLAIVFYADNNAQAADIVRTVLRAGDCVLVKGSNGMKMGEIVGRLRAE